MQVASTTSTTTIDTTTIENKRKQPSARLQEKIRNCVSMFRSLRDTVNEIIAVGAEEGFTPKEIGIFVRQEMEKAGLSRPTIAKYLPPELKMKSRGRPAGPISKNNLLNSKSTTTLTFDGRVSKSGQRLRVIYVPAKLHQDIDKRFVGKDLKITINVCS
jgi:hypothetical protein